MMLMMIFYQLESSVFAYRGQSLILSRGVVPTRRRSAKGEVDKRTCQSRKELLSSDGGGKELVSVTSFRSGFSGECGALPALRVTWFMLFLVFVCYTEL